MRTSAGPLAGLFPLALAACVGGDAAQPMLVTDSAGVRVVVHPPGPRDTVHAGEPVLVIGREGDPRYELFRVNHVAPLSDGRILVSNAGTLELRTYSPEGEYLASAGGRGRGPGELGFLGVVQVLPGDTVVVNDPPARRVAIFSGEPAYLESVSWAAPFGEVPDGAATCFVPGYMGLVGSRTLVLRDWSCIESGPTEGVRGQAFEPFLWDPSSGERRPLTSFGFAFHYERPSAPPRERLTPLPFAPVLAADYTPEGVFMASLDAHVVRFWGSDGTLRTEIRDLFPRRPVDAAARAVHERSLSAEALARLRGVPYPDSLPGYDRLVVGGGQIWARHYELPHVETRHWSVYASTGERLGTVGLPARFEVRAVAGGRAYGVSRDDLDVERVEVYHVPLGKG